MLELEYSFVTLELVLVLIAVEKHFKETSWLKAEREREEALQAEDTATKACFE